MHAVADLSRGTPVAFDMPLRDFLRSRLVRRFAAQARCSPRELILDHLGAEPATCDPEELGAAIAEACETATGFAVSHVALDEHDIRFAVGGLFLVPVPYRPFTPEAV